MTCRNLITPLFVLFACSLYAQEAELPYRAIPDYPSQYTPGTVAARIVDGVGFRYYWATEGLRDEDLKFKPSEDGRTTEETLQHIYELSLIIVNSTLKKVSDNENVNLPFEELRRRTLLSLQEASQILKANGNAGLEEFNIVFKGEEENYAYPFWNQLNGPIADALWHIGQVVTHRRSSGNPFNNKVSVFTGKVRD